MIAVTNLRIGNIVSHTQGEICCLNAEKMELLLDEKIQVSPIRLSEKWITSFGFQKTGYAKQFLLNGVWLDNRYPFYTELDYGILAKRKIRYVHELQNLYRFLTGKNLLEPNTTSCEQVAVL